MECCCNWRECHILHCLLHTRLCLHSHTSTKIRYICYIYIGQYSLASLRAYMQCLLAVILSGLKVEADIRCVCWCSSVYTAVHRSILPGFMYVYWSPQCALCHSRLLNVCSMTNYGQRAFAHAGPHTWNSLSEHVRQTATIDLFRRSLKRFYSGRYRAQHIRVIPFNGLYEFTYLLTYLL